MSVRDKGGDMRRNRKFLSVILIVLLPGLFLASPADAWNSHGACTNIIIGDQEWLKAYDNITVTPWTYADVDTASVGPNFVQQFIEGAPGTVTSAVAILTNYADEPDWKMDQDLNLSPLQVLTGGSQGWRHQYYGLGWLRLGVARLVRSTSLTWQARRTRSAICIGHSATLRGHCTTCRIRPSRITAFQPPLDSSSRESVASAPSWVLHSIITTTSRDTRVQ